MLDTRTNPRLANLWDDAKASDDERAGAAALPLQSARLRQAHHQLWRRQHLVQGDGEGPADRREGRGAVGEGFGRRHRLDQARRLRHALHGQARRPEEALSRRRARGRDGGLPAPLHLQPQSARRLDRHAAARLRAADACRPHASRRDHRDCRGEEQQGTDGKRSSATRSAGCRGSGPGFELGLWLEKFCRENPQAKGVVLESHGLFTWGDTPQECYETTIRIINQAIEWFESETTGKAIFGGEVRKTLAGGRAPRHRRTADADNPRHDLGRRAQGRPFRRSAGGAGVRQFEGAGHGSRRSAPPAPIISCAPRSGRWWSISIRPIPMSTRRSPAWARRSRTTARAMPPITTAASMPTRPAMRDPNAVVYLVPGVGMFTFASDKATARISGEFYVNAINVMRGASDRLDLCRPARAGSLRHRILAARGGQAAAHAEAEVAGRQDRAGHRRRRRHRQGDGASASCAKAPAWCSPTSTTRRSPRPHDELAGRHTADAVRSVKLDVTREQDVVDGFAFAAVEFGGIDILVSNAGIASSAPIEETELSLWNRNMDILVDRLFPGHPRGVPPVERRRSAERRLRRLEERACRLAQRRRLLHGQGRRDPPRPLPGARRRGVGDPGQHGQPRRGAARLENLDRRVERAARRRLQDEPDDLEEHYRTRSMLKLSVFPRTSPRRSIFFASDMSAKSTGNIINVDAGNAQSFTR